MSKIIIIKANKKIKMKKKKRIMKMMKIMTVKQILLKRNMEQIDHQKWIRKWEWKRSSKKKERQPIKIALKVKDLRKWCLKLCLMNKKQIRMVNKKFNF